MTIYSKSLLAGSDKVLIIDLVINQKSLIVLLAPADKIYLYFLRVTARARHQQERAAIQERYINAHQLEISKARLFGFVALPTQGTWCSNDYVNPEVSGCLIYYL